MLREISMEELTVELFSDFRRHQEVTQCWRKREGEWVIIDNPFTEEWSQAHYRCLVEDLRNTLATGGVVYGYFESGVLKGFSSVEPEFFGSRGQCLELSSLHVSEELRGRGIGRALMSHARKWAKARGAEKLYISAHSSVESQAFYRAVGCREAEEYSRPHVEKEPYDCQLECGLTDLAE